MASESGTFKARSGEAISFDLYLPASCPARAILLCQGLSGVKDFVLPDVGNALARVGFASLAFDYRGYGESEGARGWIDGEGRLSDAHDAFDYLARRSEVTDLPGIYGLSFGGGIAYALASQRHVAAVAATGGFASGERLMRGMRTATEFVDFKAKLNENRRNGADVMVPLADIFPFSDRFLAAYRALPVKNGGPHSSSVPQQTTFHLSSADLLMRFNILDALKRIAPAPILIQHGTNDDVIPIEDVLEIYRSAGEPKTLVVREGAGHVDMDSGPGFDAQVANAIRFFEANMPHVSPA